MWTAKTVKAELPQVKIRIGSVVSWARVTGRANQFATVSVTNDKPRSGVPLWLDFQFAWETIANALNADIALTV